MRSVEVVAGHSIFRDGVAIKVRTPFGIWCVGRNEWLKQFLSNDGEDAYAPACFKTVEDARSAIRMLLASGQATHR